MEFAIQDKYTITKDRIQFLYIKMNTIASNMRCQIYCKYPGSYKNTFKNFNNCLYELYGLSKYYDIKKDVKDDFEKWISQPHNKITESGCLESINLYDELISELVRHQKVEV